MSAIFADAKRQARFGHRDWIYWRDAKAVDHAEPLSAAALKAALLAASTAIPHTINWRQGTLMLRNVHHLLEHA